MPMVLAHYFPQEDLYKISYTAKDNVAAFEYQQKMWRNKEYKLKWRRDFASVEEAKDFKKNYTKGLPKAECTFLKSDTYSEIPDPFLTEFKPSAPKDVFVHLVQFDYEGQTLYKVGYSTFNAENKYAALDKVKVIWDAKVAEGELTARKFATYISNKYEKVPVDISYVGRGLIIEDVPRDVKALAKEWLDLRPAAEEVF